MAYRIEKNKETGYPEIIIDGFENGIADSPHEGLSDIRNSNITSIPGESMVNYSTVAMSVPLTVSAASFTATASNDTVTWTSSGTMYNGTAIQLNTTSAGGTSTGIVYYIGNVSGNTFQLFTTIDGISGFVAGTPLNITTDGSGTFSTYTLGNPTHSSIDYSNTFVSSTFGFRQAASYIIDAKNQVWLLVPNNIIGYPQNVLLFTGNIGSTVGTGVNSIAIWKGYLFVFRHNEIDYWKIDVTTAPASNWTYTWSNSTSYVPTSTVSLRCIVAQDDAIYICNGSQVDSLLEIDGQTFNPSSSSTYIINSPALALPTNDTALCLAELGVNLLVGGRKSFIYPWDRVSTSFFYPLIIPEPNISTIVSTNSNAYIFAGSRGNIYITNGSAVDKYKKIPDYLSGLIDPYYITGGTDVVGTSLDVGRSCLGDSIYWRNQLIFSFTTVNNSGTIQNELVGLWAIDLNTDALRLINIMSYEAYSGRIPVIVPNLASVTPNGGGLFAAWSQSNGTPGVDVSSTTPYSNYETYVDTDIIPIGTAYEKLTASQIEFKLSTEMVSGEKIQILQRSNITNNFTEIGETTSAVLSDVYGVNFEAVQWLQLRIMQSSTATNPSFTRLREVIIRPQQ